MPAVWILPLFGILQGIGYALCPAAMIGGAVSTVANRIGWVLSRTASAVYDNRGFLTAAAAGYILSGKKLQGAFAGLAGVLLFNSYSGIPFFMVFFPSVLDSELSKLALYGANAVTGLIMGLLGAGILNQRSMRGHPLRQIIVCAAVLTVSALCLLGARIGLFHLLAGLGEVLAQQGNAGAALFAALNRLLAPFELHRPLNYAVLSEAGAGDMSYFWGQVTDGDPGKFMSGFFPPMMFGIPAFCLAQLRKRRNQNTPRLREFLILCAVCAFSCGLAEPFEYWLILTSPLCYGLYALSFAVSAGLCTVTGFRAGFACSGGFVDLLFSAAMPAAANTWLIIPLGLLFALLFYLLSSRLRESGGEESDIIELENVEEAT